MRFENIANGIGGNMNCECKRFDSLHEFFEAAPADRLERFIGDVSRDVVDWVGRQIADRDELNRFSTAVWSEGMDMLDAARSRVDAANVPAPRNRRRRARFDEFDGDDICLDRLRDGAPFWRTTQRETTTGPTSITIAIEQGGPAYRSADELIWRGIAAIVLTELLEAAGYRVCLVTYNAGTEVYTDDSDAFYSVELKRETDPLDVVTFVNALSGWAFRTVGIGVLGQSQSGRKVSSGCGVRRQIDAEQFATLHGSAADVLINNVWDEFAAVDLIEKTLERIQSGTLAAA
jgi:hypothetical protein